MYICVVQAYRDIENSKSRDVYLYLARVAFSGTRPAFEIPREISRAFLCVSERRLSNNVFSKPAIWVSTQTRGEQTPGTTTALAPSRPLNYALYNLSERATTRYISSLAIHQALTVTYPYAESARAKIHAGGRHTNTQTRVARLLASYAFFSFPLARAHRD